MKIALVNESGVQQVVKVGFSWTVFFFAFFFGIPLFLRKLIWQGFVMVAFMFVYYWGLFSAQYIELFGERIYVIFGQRISEEDLLATTVAYFIIYFIVLIYFSVNANRWYAQNLIQEGYKPQYPDRDAIRKFAQYAKIDERVLIKDSGSK